MSHWAVDLGDRGERRANRPSGAEPCPASTYEFTYEISTVTVVRPARFTARET